MYKCQLCRAQSKDGEKANKLVVETRQTQYTNFVRRGKKEITIRSEGSEIVREVLACAPCAKVRLAA